MLWETISVVLTAAIARNRHGDDSLWRRHLVRLLGISAPCERAAGFCTGTAPVEMTQIEAPVRIRRALEELDPPFVKLGQMLGRGRHFPAWMPSFGETASHVPGAVRDSAFPAWRAIKGSRRGICTLIRCPGRLHRAGAPSHAQDDAVCQDRRPGIEG